MTTCSPRSVTRPSRRRETPAARTPKCAWSGSAANGSGSATPDWSRRPTTPRLASACAWCAEGSIGFAASVALTTDEVRHVVDQAVNAARVTAFAATTRVELAPEPSHGEVDWRSEYDTDPVEVPLVDKVELLAA